MFVAHLDNPPTELIPLSEALQLTGLDRSVLEPLEAGQEPIHPLWEDTNLTTSLLSKLGRSISPTMSVDELPKLPDQLAILLRNELTMVSTQYPLTAEEKDQFERQLQDALRPLIYAIIEQKLSGASLQANEKEAGYQLGRSINLGWQTLEIDGWQILELDSALGPLGFRFSKNEDHYLAVDEERLTGLTQFYLQLGDKILEIFM